MEDFFDTFMEALESLREESADLRSLLQIFNDDGQSNYLIVFMRLLTALNIKAQHEFYQNFLEGGQVKGPDYKLFCCTHLEARASVGHRPGLFFLLLAQNSDD